MAVCRELPPLEEEEGANSVRPLPPIVKAVTELRLSATAKSMIALQATKFTDVQSDDFESGTEKVQQYKSGNVDKNSSTGVVFGQKHEE